MAAANAIEPLPEGESARIKRGEHRSIRTALYSVLRDDIVNGRLQPGKTINIKAVQRQFGTGLSAVREALWQLAADGLVIAEDQRGFNAAPVSKRDLTDLTRVRIEIETLALRDAITNGDIEWEGRILSTFHKLSHLHRNDGRRNDEDYREGHRAFHDALVSACTSDWLQRIRGTLHQHSERYQKLASRYNDQPRDIMAEHREIMDATLSRDSFRATRAATEHINETARILLRLGMTGVDEAAAINA